MKQNNVSDFRDDYFYKTFWIFSPKKKKTRNVSETSMPPMVQNSGLSSL